jgi:hypothetical protein
MMAVLAFLTEVTIRAEGVAALVRWAVMRLVVVPQETVALVRHHPSLARL